MRKCCRFFKYDIIKTDADSEKFFFVRLNHHIRTKAEHERSLS